MAKTVKEANSPYEGFYKAISLYEKEFKKWEGRVEKIIRRYRDEPQNSRGYNLSKMNILWSNVQTAMPAVYARLPKPDVSRRFKDNDPVGRVAANILERALDFEIDHYNDYRATLDQCVLDRFLGGRATSWVRYEPHIVTVDQPEDGLEITEDVDEAEDETPEANEQIEYECSPCDYVSWKDFGHSVARTWEEVTTVWRKVYMGREALVERFGEEIGYKIPLDTKPEDLKKISDNGGDHYEAMIYEIWDKPSNTAYWLSKSLGQMIDQKEDPLELDGFWPCPRPLFATLTNESLIPVPDFALYQDQANTLDILADRIEGLIKALQVKGAYDSSVPELARIFTEGESGTMIPVKNWAAFAEKNGLKGSINLVELQPIFQALEACYRAVDEQKKQIYEITGLSDIVRGSTEAGETATAQKLKGQFGSMRLRQMQMKVAQFATELLQIKAQIICKHYTTDTIIKIGGCTELPEADFNLVPQAIKLLKNVDASSFRIEIAADSMVQMDEIQEKQDRVEFLTATSQYMEKVLPVGQQSPELVPLLMEMLKFGVTGFKAGKGLEGEIDATADKLKQIAAQPKQPQPNPDLIKIQAQTQADQQQMQMNAQAKQQEAQIQMQLEQHKQEMQAQQIQHQNQIEAQRSALEAQHNAQLEQQRIENDARLEFQRQQFDLLIAQMNNQAKVEVAEIAAKTALDTAQISAAQQGTQNESGQ